MKNIFAGRLLAFILGIVSVNFYVLSLEARDLTYKLGAGFKQVYTNGFALDGGATSGRTQLSGVTVSYGIARDMSVDGVFALTKNFDATMMGGSFRYDLQRLISRNLAAWNYINLFAQVGGFIKMGDDVKTGLTMQLPYAGFEIFPFDANDFSVQAAAGLVVDLVDDNMIGFTNGALGVDLGIKYYF